MKRLRDPRIAGLVLFGALVLPRAVEATVAEQRARLPPPAECTDPVTGVWMSHHFSPRRGCWDQFTLIVRRSASDPQVLEGEMLNHLWEGDADDLTPPPCTGGQHYKVEMPAAGRLDGDNIELWGTSFTITEKFCGGRANYNLDHFSGVIDHALHEFQTVNNDGGDAVNEPTVFRRVRCSEDGPAPRLVVAPPPFYPPSSGCWGS